MLLKLAHNKLKTIKLLSFGIKFEYRIFNLVCENSIGLLILLTIPYI